MRFWDTTQANNLKKLVEFPEKLEPLLILSMEDVQLISDETRIRAVIDHWQLTQSNSCQNRLISGLKFSPAAPGQFDFELIFLCLVEFDQDQASTLLCLKCQIPAKPWTDQRFGTVVMKQTQVSLIKTPVVSPRHCA
jgi:hypothetical protein